MHHRCSQLKLQTLVLADILNMWRRYRHRKGPNGLVLSERTPNGSTPNRIRKLYRLHSLYTASGVGGGAIAPNPATSPHHIGGGLFIIVGTT